MKEIPLKQWLAEEAKREGVSPGAIDSRVRQGKYSNLELRRVNKRVVWVRQDALAQVEKKD